MEEQSCVLLENGRRISAFASQLPFMRGTALTPDLSIKNRHPPPLLKQKSPPPQKNLPRRRKKSRIFPKL